MSGVWSLDGRNVETLDWEQTVPFGNWASAYGKPGADGWRPVYWVEKRAKRRFVLEVIGPDEDRAEIGEYCTLGAAQEAAEGLEASGASLRQNAA